VIREPLLGSLQRLYRARVAAARPPLLLLPEQGRRQSLATRWGWPNGRRPSDNTDFFEALAARHAGEYDGWEAGVRPAGRSAEAGPHHGQEPRNFLETVDLPLRDRLHCLPETSR
jgi:hypothetical protein